MLSVMLHWVDWGADRPVSPQDDELLHRACRARAQHGEVDPRRHARAARVARIPLPLATTGRKLPRGSSGRVENGAGTQPGLSRHSGSRGLWSRVYTHPCVPPHHVPRPLFETSRFFLDLGRKVVSISGPRVSPDGKLAAYLGSNSKKF
jgi:hypothetical protein